MYKMEYGPGGLGGKAPGYRLDDTGSGGVEILKLRFSHHHVQTELEVHSTSLATSTGHSWG